MIIKYTDIMSDSSEKEREIKKKLLGTPKFGDTGKRFKPDPAQLKEEFGGPKDGYDSYLHSFCENCGAHSECSKEYITGVSKKLDFVKEIDPDSLDPQNQYIHKDSCSICRKEFEIFEVRDIPNK